MAQARVEAIIAGVLVAFFVLLAGIGFWLIWKGVRLPRVRDGNWSDSSFGCFILGILGAIVGVTINMVSIPTLLLNPEYWALQKILETLGR